MVPHEETTQAAHARAIRDRARLAPDEVDPLEPMALLEAPRPAVRQDAIEALREIADARPEAAIDAVPRLIGLLGTVEQSADVHILEVASAVARVEPDAVVPFLEPVIERIHNRTAPPALRAAVKVVATIAAERPSAGVDAVPSMAAVLEEGDEDIAKQILAALSFVASAHPNEVRPLFGPLCDRLDATDTRILQGALATIGRLLEAGPVGASAVLEPAIDLLTHTEAGVRANAAAMLGDYLALEPTAGTTFIDELFDALADDDPTVRANAMTAIARVALATPELIYDRSGVIESALTDTEARVRERACFALGISGIESARPTLEATAADDPDSMVVDRATWALNRLD